MLPYLLLEGRRMLRDRRFVIFTLVMPVVYYAIFTNAGARGSLTASPATHGLPVDEWFMVGMAGFGALAGVLLAGAGVAHDRASGWVRQLSVTPVPPVGVIGGRVAAGVALALPGILAVFVVAAFDHGVRLGAGEWGGVALALWLGLLPFAPLGLAVGYLSTPQSAGPMLGFLVFGLALLGGMWVPATSFPPILQAIANALPTSHYADIAWRAATGGAPALTDLAVLAGWLVVLSAAAAFAYRRAVGAR